MVKLSCKLSMVADEQKASRIFNRASHRNGTMKTERAALSLQVTWFRAAEVIGTQARPVIAAFGPGLSKAISNVTISTAKLDF